MKAARPSHDPVRTPADAGRLARGGTGSGNRGLLELTGGRGGQPSIELVATHIDRSASADSIFVPPAGYRALTLHEALGEELGHR